MAGRTPGRRAVWHFRGDWRLTRIGEAGCRIVFEVMYEIADGFFLDRIAKPAVEFVSHRMIDAFVRRAEITLVVAEAARGVAPDSASPRVAASIDHRPHVDRAEHDDDA